MIQLIRKALHYDSKEAVKVMPSSLLQSDGGVVTRMMMVSTFTTGSREL